MVRHYTRLLFAAAILSFGQHTHAQTVITQWNFNSNPPDASNSTGLSIPSTGTGTLTTVGGTASLFASGNAGTGSSDPQTTDNTGMGVNTFPTQGTADKTAGIQFAVSTVGHSNIQVSFDVRPSNTSTRHMVLQYTTDITATTPVWVDFRTDAFAAGDAWVNGRTYDLSTVTTLNNNANAGFRVVSTFEPATSNYVAANSGSTWAATGNWRFDMLTVSSGTVAANAKVAFVGAKTSVNENGTEVKLIAKLTDGGAAPMFVDIELIPLFGTATSGVDFTLPGSLQFNWAANANNVNDTITIAIADDAIAEAAEYFAVRFKTPVGIDLPATKDNHHTVFILDNDKQAPAATNAISLEYITSFSNGTAGDNSAEIVAYDPTTKRLFIANSIGGKIDIVNFSNPASPTLISSNDITSYGNINSVAVKNGVVAAAIENTNPQGPGKVVFFNTDGTFISQVNVGAMPDMITFNNAGTKVFTPNEGEPNAEYTNDPEGTVSIIDISGGVGSVTQANVTTADFSSFNAQEAALKADGIRIFGPGATVAKDFEPEYITVSDDDQTIWVACQENNAIATIDVATATVTKITPLKFKDYTQSRNALDGTNEGTEVQIANWPVKGVYMPDAIASYKVGGQTYIITANEGDAREYDGYEETGRLSAGSYTLDPTVFPYADVLKANIGRINITTASGDTDGDGDFDEIHTYGARSFSIWNAATGTLVWDSGDDFEMITSKHPVYAPIFNASNANNNFKDRSDDKGPEPEGVTIATINGKVYAFVALERIGGCMVYDVSDPTAPVFVDYKNSRTIASYGGDQGSEGIVLISSNESPNGKAMIVLANEVSSTLSFYEIKDNDPLSVTMSDISATNVDTRNRIDWTTADEATTDLFEVEKSDNGKDFKYLATVKVSGQPSAYSCWDEQPVNGWNYYRLKLINSSGKNTYSKIVTALVGGGRTFSVNAYPNPVKDQLTIKIYGLQGKDASIQVTDLKGTVLRTLPVTASETEVDMRGIPAGIYLVKYADNEGTESIKITKQ